MKSKSLIIFIGIGFSCMGYAIDTSKEEKICEDLGFVRRTEPFGNCVLKMISRNSDSHEAYQEKETNHRDRESQRLLEDARRRIERIERDKYDERARQRRAEEDADRRRQAKSVQDFSDFMNKENRRSICKSWGNQYCD